ncbi:MAG: alpha,alpha-phosphotrehalase [Anaeromassilibacillus sp.]|nr:alpha,alpha-phosphotrehalase [Anaeromassilibacillus sp.]MDY3778794.1 alpha,alpha-phosphotrehalase [Candidatus Limousia pullorum]
MEFKRQTVYQIYPKSFNDSNGDGLGDLKGVTDKLLYLKELGIDYIWLTPFFISPQNDNGYDVADYRNIDPRYGTIEDAENLISEAGKLDIGIMLDMVFNHTSTEHEWFKKAMEGDPKYMDYYIFRDPKPDGSAPTNWVSKFGGNAWEYVPKFNKYYLHLFDKTQADLNWENPQVREELKDILKFWQNKGVKGFRFDVVNLISKPDVFEDDFEGDGRRFYTDGIRVHQYLKELCRDSGLNENGMMTVGEMSSTTIDNCIRYSNPEEKELSMCFSFHHLKVDYKNGNKWELQPCDFMALKNLLNKWQTGMEEGNGWNALFWCNHDQPRVLSRFGNDKNYPTESAEMLATMIHLMRGTPYVYQGEEIAMTNAYFEDISQYKDVESLNYFKILKDDGIPEDEVYEILRCRSRDNSRTPMQWDNSENAGFTTGTPWIEVNKNYKTINADNAVKNKNSVFHYYKKLIALRKENDVIAYGSYNPEMEDNTNVCAYSREYEGKKLFVVCNFYGTETKISLPDEFVGKEILISNYKDAKAEKEITLRPFETFAVIK